MRLWRCAPTGIRTPVVALKGLRPSPLDDGGILKRADFITPLGNGQAFCLFFIFGALTKKRNQIYSFAIEQDARAFHLEVWDQDS